MDKNISIADICIDGCEFDKFEKICTVRSLGCEYVLNGLIEEHNNYYAKLLIDAELHESI